jgi:hypothetical protein
LDDPAARCQLVALFVRLAVRDEEIVSCSLTFENAFLAVFDRNSELDMTENST